MPQKRARSRATGADTDEITDAALYACRGSWSRSARSLAGVADQVTLPQYRTLVVLAAKGPQSLRELAAVLDVHTSTATPCDRLVRKRLIRRRQGRQDRRRGRTGPDPVGSRPGRRGHRTTSSGNRAISSVGCPATTGRHRERGRRPSAGPRVRFPSKRGHSDGRCVIGTAAGLPPPEEEGRKPQEPSAEVLRPGAWSGFALSDPARLRELRHEWQRILLLAALTGVVTGLAVAGFEGLTARLLLEWLFDVPRRHKR